jgi:hypothetical protein
MINDMASLKKAMEQMDAEDPVVAEAAKDRAAKILSDAGLNFSKLAELIEQRRLLLRPGILANIKKMDQPEMLSDPAFRAAGASLRREGQSFAQIAEALELNGATAPRYEDAALRNEVPYRSEPIGPWPRTRTLAMRVISYPLRHPIRFLTIALLSVLLFNGLRDLTGLGRRVSEYAGGVSAARERWDAVTSSVSSFFAKRLTPTSKEAAAPPTPATSTPSPSPANPPPSPAPSTGPVVTPPGATTTVPPPTTAPPSTSVPPSKPAAKDRRQAAQRRPLEEWVPPEVRRRSRVSGPCVGGIGGCYWGGGHY